MTGDSQTTQESSLLFPYFPYLILIIVTPFPDLIFLFSLGIGTQKWIGTPSWSKTLRLSGGSHFACQRRSFGFHLAGSGPSLLLFSCRNTRLYPTLLLLSSFLSPSYLLTYHHLLLFYLHPRLPVLSIFSPLLFPLLLSLSFFVAPFPRYSPYLYRAFCQALTLYSSTLDVTIRCTRPSVRLSFCCEEPPNIHS